jgi:hypothetical protein
MCRCDRQSFALVPMYHRYDQLLRIRNSCRVQESLYQVKLLNNNNVDENYLFHRRVRNPYSQDKVTDPDSAELDEDKFMTPANCDALCTRLRGIPNVTRALTTTMQLSITHLLDRVYDLIPDFSEAPIGQKRQSRALFSLGERI